MALRKRAVVDMPAARAHHAGVIFGAGLFVHGGQGGEHNDALADWNLFDFGLQVWIRCDVDEIIPDIHGGESLLQPFNKYQRKSHTLTAVIEPTLTDGREMTRLLWVAPLQELVRNGTVAEQGMYMFGGIDELGNPTDDLYWVAPDIKANGRILNNKTGEFKGTLNPEVRFLARKVTPEGRGPVARAQHSATFFKNQLVIFGGRNDAIYPVIKNVALNDLHVYDVAENRWQALAIYGDLPESRWGHRLVANQEKIVIFGGMNLGTYCESVFFDIHIGK